jgi:2-polyprenyl-3-methyl-5-hydroxy-6-metoxy-1,4-benzoquinol methylase
MDSGKEENNTGIEYTGERMIPGQADEENYFEHLSRYHFAQHLVEGRRTLDAGCGDGYGSAMLAELASEVVGIDISGDAINAAAEKYKAGNLRFVAMDVKEITFEPSSFGAVVCFEVFEHIHHPEKMLEGIRKVLVPDGVLIISTPNGALVKSGKPNPFHVKEYTLQEFDEILGQYFPESDFSYERYGQFNLRRRKGPAEKAIKGWVKLKRRLGIGKIMPEGISRRLKDAKVEPYSLEDFAFTEEGIEEAEYFVFVIRGKG